MVHRKSTVLLPVVLAWLAALCPACVTSAVTPCFTPGNNCIHALKYEIEQAKIEILVQTDLLTSKPISEALVKAKESGVSVEIILDKASRSTQNTASYFFTVKGIPTYLDGNHVRANNNMMVIDRQTVITGTYPFANDTEAKNADSLLIIRSDSVAGSYISNWNEHRSHSEEFTAPAQEAPQAQPQTETQPKAEKADPKKATKKKKKPQ